MKNWKKFLILSLSFLFIVTSVLAGLANFVKVDDTSNNSGNQESGVVTPSSPDDYDGMVYYASESEETGALEAPREWKGGAIYIDNGSNFVMDGGVLSNHEGLYGGAVYVANGGTFTMTGGTIEYNYSKYGGAVYVEAGGTFIIEDGDIVNNLAENAAAIYVEAGGNLKISANAYVNANEHIIVQDTLIHYYVDGEHVYSRNQLMPAFNLGKAPLDYENCNGYFLDEGMTLPIEQNDDLTEIETSESVQSIVEQTTTDGTLEYNLYTRTATLENFNFTLNEDNVSYSVEPINENISGNVVMPNNYNNLPINQIKNGKFQSCKFETFTFNSKLAKIGNSAFYHCNNLIKIIVPNNVMEIGSGAFSFCLMLSSASLSNSLSVINEYMFNGCSSLKDVIIPSSVVTIYNEAFKSTGIDLISIPNSVTSIGNYAFGNCSNLKTVVIGDGLPSINNYMFRFSAIENLTLGKNITSITENAFNGSNIKNLNINSNINTTIFSGNTSLNTLTIGDNCTIIYERFVDECTNLENVQMSNNVTEIQYKAFHCTGIKSIVLSENLNKIGDYAFCACDRLESIVIPESVTVINNRAFNNCDNLEEVILDDLGYELSIESQVFEDCKSIKTINLEKVHKVGPYTFRNCTALESVNMETSSVTEISNELFFNCTSLKNIILPDLATNPLSSIGNSSFYNCISLESISIPRSVVTINYRAFGNCSNLSSVTFEDGSLCENINGSAFKGCTSLTSIILPSNLKKIRTGAFDGTSITSVIIPASVRRIGRLAFGTQIEEIIFEDTSGWNLVVENTAGDKYAVIEYNLDVTNNVTNITNYLRIGEQPSSDDYPNYYYFEKDLDMPLES